MIRRCLARYTSTLAPTIIKQARLIAERHATLLNEEKKLVQDLGYSSQQDAIRREITSLQPVVRSLEAYDNIESVRDPSFNMSVYVY